MLTLQVGEDKGPRLWQYSIVHSTVRYSTVQYITELTLEVGEDEGYVVPGDGVVAAGVRHPGQVAATQAAAPELAWGRASSQKLLVAHSGA